MSLKSQPDPQLIAQLKALGISENTAKYALKVRGWPERAGAEEEKADGLLVEV